MTLPSLAHSFFNFLSDPGPLSDYIHTARVHIDDCLIPDTSFRKIEDLASRLPETFALGPMLFEVTLGDGENKADFSVNFTKYTMGREILSTFLGTRDDDSEEWKGIRRFVDHWNDRENPANDDIDNIWLEFDASTGRDLIPSVFIKGPGRYDTYEEQDRKFNAIYRVFKENFIKEPDNGRLEKTLFRCHGTKPMLSRVTWLGLMLSRHNNPVRFCLYIPDDSTADYLEDIGYPGGIGAAGLMERLQQGFNAVCLNLDAGENLGTTLGFECFNRTRNVNTNPQWRTALEQARREGLCTRGQYEALFDYCGETALSQEPELMPRNLLKFCEENACMEQIFFYRGVSHLKYVYEPDFGVRVKAYLIFSLRRKKNRLDSAD